MNVNQALIPFQTSSQPIPFSGFDESTSTALGGLMTALSITESQTLDENQKTAEKCKAIMANIRSTFRELSEMNLRLKAQLDLSNSHPHGSESILHGELHSAQQEIEHLRHEVEEMNQAMRTAARTSEEQITALIFKNSQNVRLAHADGEVRSATLKQQLETISSLKDQQIAEIHAERDIAVRMATQAAEAKIEAAQQEVLAVKRDAEQQIEKLIAERKIGLESISTLVIQKSELKAYLPVIKALVQCGAL